MIASSARLSTPLARQSLCQAVRNRQNTTQLSSRTLLQASQRRMASGTAKATVETAKSDAPWAISSLVVFGGMFIYLTAPPKGGKKGHHGHDAGGHGKESHDDEEETEGEEKEFFVSKKIEDKPEEGSDAPAGSHHLAKNSLTAEEGAHKQKTTKTSDDLSKPDDITFKKGVSAAKEGHSGKEDSHISDPKKVVADAHTERQDRKGKAKEDKDAREHKEVHESPQAADANAQNESDDEDD